MAARKRAGVPVRIREVVAIDDPSFDRAYRLLRGVFPRSELMPRREWNYAMRERSLGLYTDQNWHVLVAERGTELIGVASGSYVGNVNVGVIGYIAVNPRVRSKGVGLRLRQRLRRAFERDAQRVRRRQLTAIIGEVHINNPWLRRLVRRGRAIALDFPYFQPSLRSRRRPVELVLYYEPLDRPRTSLPATELRRLLYMLWRRAYRIPRPVSRPAFRRMLRALEGRRRIGRRKLPPLEASRASRAMRES